MKIDVTLVWYNGTGGHPAISHDGSFMVRGWCDSGRFDFDTIEIYAHISSKVYDTSLSFLSNRFAQHVSELPRTWIKRKQRRIEVSYNSELGFEEDLVGADRPKPTVNYFSQACHEVAASIDLFTDRLKPSDSFSVESLKAHFTERLQSLPRTDQQLLDILKVLGEEESRNLIP